jgi:hypothetical protein
MRLHLTIEIEITDTVHACIHELHRMNVYMLFHGAA